MIRLQLNRPDLIERIGASSFEPRLLRRSDVQNVKFQATRLVGPPTFLGVRALALRIERHLVMAQRWLLVDAAQMLSEVLFRWDQCVCLGEEWNPFDHMGFAHPLDGVLHHVTY